MSVSFSTLVSFLFSFSIFCFLSGIFISSSSFFYRFFSYNSKNSITFSWRSSWSASGSFLLSFLIRSGSLVWLKMNSYFPTWMASSSVSITPFISSSSLSAIASSAISPPKQLLMLNTHKILTLIFSFLCNLLQNDPFYCSYSTSLLHRLFSF